MKAGEAFWKLFGWSMGAMMRALPGAMTVGNREIRAHLRDGSETESTESAYSYTQHMYSGCAVSASMNHEEKISTLPMLTGGVQSRAERGGTIRVDF